MWEMIGRHMPMLLEGSGETLYITFASAFLAYLIGVPLGIALIVTDKGGLRPQRAFNAVLGWIVNIGRSIPFIILMLVISPLTRLIVGRAYGTNATIVPLVGYSAMAGAVGGGGLGDIAVRYGMHRYEYDVMILTLVLIVIIVQVIQVVFDLIAKKIDKKVK